MKNWLILFLFFSVLSFSQNTVSGVIYDKKGRLHNIKVINVSTGNLVYTSQEGLFTIEAKVNDTLRFSSIFYEGKRLKLTAKDFKEKILVVLKENVFEIDEVKLKSKPKIKEFSPKKFNNSLRDEIKEDIKRNPHLYGVRGEDIVFRFIAKLFKRKRKKEKVIIAKYEQLDSLFKNDTFFNKELLEKRLNIDKDEIFLFLIYCETKKINLKLLSENKRIIFLDTLFKYSKEFNALPAE